MRISKDSRARVAKRLLSHPRIRVRVLTKGKQLLLAEETTATRDRKWHHNTVAHFQISHFTTHFHNLAHELMTENIALLHRGNETIVEVQIGTADCRRRDLQDRVALVEDLRIRNLLDAHRRFAIPTVCSHRSVYLPSDP